MHSLSEASAIAWPWSECTTIMLMELSNHREYDFTYETIDPYSLPRTSLVLVKINNSDDNLKFDSQPKMAIADSIKEGEKLLYSKVISFADLLDPTLFYKEKFGSNSLKLIVKNEKSDQTMTIDFSGSKCTMFDISTLGISMKHDKFTPKD